MQWGLPGARSQNPNDHVHLIEVLANVLESIVLKISHLHKKMHDGHHVQYDVRKAVQGAPIQPIFV